MLAYLGYLILVQPLLPTAAFSFLVQQVLGRSDLSEVPYAFVMAGVIPWQFFNSLNESLKAWSNVDLVRQSTPARNSGHLPGLLPTGRRGGRVWFGGLHATSMCPSRRGSCCCH